MRILAIDTSTSLASLAIADDERIVAESVFSTDRTLSARIIPEIERLLSMAGLELSRIDLFAASIGPGSFTGVRAGVATIQGLALATGKPCAGYSSLASLAMNFPLAAHPVCALLDARKNEVYAALYDCTSTIPTQIINESVIPPERLLEQCCAATTGPIIFVGDGTVRYADLITSQLDERAILAQFPYHVGHASHGTLLAKELHRTGCSVTPPRLLPVYLRASEAEYAKINQQKSTKPNPTH